MRKSDKVMEQLSKNDDNFDEDQFVTPLDLLIGILCFSLIFDLSLSFNNTYIALINYVQHWFLSRHKLHLSFIIYGLTFSYQSCADHRAQI
jgi:hypothetical protein